ncbi:MAG: hypothetical protein AB7N91_02230 [Candidatus Tectimicrobiota bacterium]
MQLQPVDPRSPDRAPALDRQQVAVMRYGLQCLLSHTLQTVEHLGRNVGDTMPAVPWACSMDLARQIADTCRHIEILRKLLAYLPADAETEPDLPRRSYALTAPQAAAQHPSPQQSPAETSAQLLARLLALAHYRGDCRMTRALDAVLADHLNHARMGDTWLHVLNPGATAP